MPFNIQPFPFKLSGKDLGAFDLGDALSKGFKDYQTFQEAKNTPKRLSEALLAAHLNNKINTAKAKYAEQNEAAGLQQKLAAIERLKRGPALPQDIQTLQWLQDHPNEFGGDLKEVPIENETVPELGQESRSYVQSLMGNRPIQKVAPKEGYASKFRQHILNKITGQKEEGAYQGVAREAYDLQRLKDAYGENSPVYQDALKLAALKQSNQESLTSQRERRSTGLKPGEDWISNKESEHVGVSRPFVEREKKELSGRNFFNVVYPEILKSTSYYSGQGSITRFNDDIANYNTNKSSQKRVDNYLTALQLIPSASVKENATIGGANTNQVYNRLIKSIKSSDLPQVIEDLESQYRLPRGAKLRAGMKFQSILNKATKAGEKIPARKVEYLNGNKEGHIYNKKTKKLEKVSVPLQEWDAFIEEGGY